MTIIYFAFNGVSNSEDSWPRAISLTFRAKGPILKNVCWSVQNKKVYSLSIKVFLQQNVFRQCVWFLFMCAVVCAIASWKFIGFIAGAYVRS